jgi:hypothetical protein
MNQRFVMLFEEVNMVRIAQVFYTVFAWLHVIAKLLQLVQMANCNFDCLNVNQIRWVWDFIRDKTNPHKSKWLLQGLLESIPAQVSSMQVSQAGDEIAIGTTNGFLLVIFVNLFSNFTDFRSFEW